MNHVRGCFVLSSIVATAVLFGADVDIAARGPASVIPNDASAIARITSLGDDGPIRLEGEWTNSILQVQQNVATGAVVRMFDGVTNKTLLVSALKIADGQSDLTIGESEGDGVVSALTPGSGLLLENASAGAVLTVNADVVNNTTATTLSKAGAGKVVLTGANAYSGATLIDEGELAFGGNSTQTLVGVISGAGSLVKEGGRTLGSHGCEYLCRPHCD